MDSKISILIDESGTLPDPKDKVIIMAMIFVSKNKKPHEPAQAPIQ